MNKTALQDIQKTLNIIRNRICAVDNDTKWAALELMLASSTSVVALAKKMTKPDTKTVTHTIFVPKTKNIKQPAPQRKVGGADDTQQSITKPVAPQKPLSIKRASQ